MITPSRRIFLTGLVSFVAAPAIVRVSSLMPIKPIVPIFPVSQEIIDLMLQTNQLLEDMIIYGAAGWKINNDSGLITRIPPTVWMKLNEDH